MKPTKIDIDERHRRFFHTSGIIMVIIIISLLVYAGIKDSYEKHKLKKTETEVNLPSRSG